MKLNSSSQAGSPDGANRQERANNIVAAERQIRPTEEYRRGGRGGGTETEEGRAKYIPCGEDEDEVGDGGAGVEGPRGAVPQERRPPHVSPSGSDVRLMLLRLRARRPSCWFPVMLECRKCLV
jgi:hypothetical protein